MDERKYRPREEKIQVPSSILKFNETPPKPHPSPTSKERLTVAEILPAGGLPKNAQLQRTALICSSLQNSIISLIPSLKKTMGSTTLKLTSLYMSNIKLCVRFSPTLPKNVIVYLLSSQSIGREHIRGCNPLKKAEIHQ